MALNTFGTSQLPSLVDWASQADPDGQIATVAWLLSQCNEILKDLIFHEGNQPTGHKTTVNSGLPQGTWRGNNQGVAATKPLFSQFEFTIGMLTDYSLVDKAEATLMGDLDKFRWNLDQAHVEGLSQQVASAIFYSNEAVTPGQFTGLSPYYNTLTAANAQTAANVINGGGAGNSNASLWFLSFGDRSSYAIHPKGSQAGLVYEDKGDIRQLYDANGNLFEGYTSYFEWKIGMVVQDWRYNVRIANLDTTTAGLLGSNPPDLNVMMSEAINKIPTTTRRLSGIIESDAPGDPVPGNNQAWYCNRTVRTALDIQAIRDKNVLIGMKEYAGEPVLDWRGIPVKVVDALLNTEATIS